VILVGLPGAGKTTVGRAVARALGRRFLDFDEEIARRERRSIARIFSESGESYFRELETALTRQLAGERGMILSPGGGWATDPARVALLCPPARMIHLRVSSAVAVGRLGSDASARPLLASAGTPAAMVAILEWLSREREASYSRAEAAVDTEDVDLQGVIDRVTRLVAP
jgi:shikimate kinase